VRAAIPGGIKATVNLDQRVVSLDWKRGVQMREPDGFTDFVSGHQHRLQRTAFLLTGDWQVAEDLVQTALAKAWVHWSGIARADRPEMYVRRVIVTTFISWRRRRWWRNELAAEDLPEQQDRADLQAEAANRLVARKLLAALPARQRAILVLRFFDDLTEMEVAAMMGCTVGTVKSQSAKALASLRGHADVTAWREQGLSR
jgi:RNA polymerase sigma-70 factor (sigma-E family)